MKTKSSGKSQTQTVWKTLAPAPGYRSLWLVCCDDALVATVADNQNSERDARLIAAAPELLESCKRIYEEMGSRLSLAAFEEFSEESKEMLKLAIAKAEGR